MFTVSVVVAFGVGVAFTAPRAAAAPRVPVTAGYWEVATDGGVFAFGDATFFGSMGGSRLAKPIVGMAATPDGKGYWEVATDGGVFAFGDATFFGSMGGTRLAKPIVGMAATPDGKGYWEVATDGGVFAFGDATFFGSTGALRLASPVVGVAAAPDGKGYWLAAADGGVFSYGDAPYAGSVPGLGAHRNDIVAITASGGAGYLETAADGTTWSFGGAATQPSLSSMGARVHDIAGTAATADGGGLWEAGSDGGVFAVGDAAYAGSLPALGVHHVHVVGVAASAPLMPSTPPTSPAGGTLPPGGAAWSPPQSFDAASTGASQVSCPTSGFCVAVDGTDELFTWRGTWSSPTVLTGPTLDAVSCASPTFCVATGSTAPPGGVPETDAVIYDGTSWTAASSFAPEPTVSGLVAVSCPTPTFCAAVGDQSTPTGAFGTLVEAFDGSAWSVVPTPDPDEDAIGGYSLRAVSCAVATSCEAIGTYTSQSGDSWSFMEGSTGSTWSVSVTPGLQEDFKLASVSCTTATWCMAVGSESFPQSPTPPTALVETYDGTAWTSDPTPPSTPLWPVACTGVSQCVAGGPGGIVVVDDGGTWGPADQVDGGNILTALSCTVDGFCMATDNTGNALTSGP